MLKVSESKILNLTLLLKFTNFLGSFEKIDTVIHRVLDSDKRAVLFLTLW